MKSNFAQKIAATAVMMALASVMSACVVAPPQQHVVYRSTSDLLPTYVNGQYVGMKPSMSGADAAAMVAPSAQVAGAVPSPPQAAAPATVVVQQTPAPSVVVVPSAPYYDPYYASPYGPYYVNPYGVAVGVGIGFGFGRCCGHYGWRR